MMSINSIPGVESQLVVSVVHKTIPTLLRLHLEAFQPKIHRKIFKDQSWNAYLLGSMSHPGLPEKK